MPLAREGPGGVKFGSHKIDYYFVSSALGQVGVFAGIGLIVVQFHTKFSVLPPLGVTIAVSTNRAAKRLWTFQTARHFSPGTGNSERGIADRFRGVIQQRDDAFALEVPGLGQATQVGKRWIKIGQLHE